MGLLIRRPLSAGEVLDLSFAIARRHLWSLLGLGGAPLAIALLLDHFVRIIGISNSAGLVSFVSMAAYGIAECRISLGAWQLLHGQSIDAVSVRRQVWIRAIPIVLGYMLKWLLVILGLILLVVPGVLVLLRWFAVPAVTAIEGLGVRESARRSRSLARGHLRRLLATIGVFDFAIIAISLSFGFFYADQLTGDVPLWTEILGWVVTCLLVPYRSTLVAALYTDIRVREEAYDLEAAAADLPRSSIAMGD